MRFRGWGGTPDQDRTKKRLRAAASSTLGPPPAALSALRGLLPSPELSERCHRALASCRVAVSWYAVFVMSES
jgi:hypothetical protein